MIYGRRSSTVQAREMGHDIHARHAIQDYATSARNRVAAAASASGTGVVLYRQMSSGLVCTCHYDAKAVPILDEDGNMQSGVLRSVLEGSRILGFDDYPDQIVPADDTLVPEEDAEADGLHSRDYDLPDNYEDDYDEDDGFRPISPFSSFCPVCTRTGYVGGMHLHGGYRKVVDAQGLSFKLAAVDHDRSPHLIVVESGATVSFSAVLPSGAWRADACRAMNGTHPVKAEISVDNTVLPNTAGILRYCDGRSHDIIMAVESDLTHAEIQLATAPLFDIPADLSALSQVLSTRSLSDVETMTIVVSGEVPIARGDVFFDSKIHQLWVVTGVDPSPMADLYTGLQVSASRVLPEHEPYPLFNPYEPGAGRAAGRTGT